MSLLPAVVVALERLDTEAVVARTQRASADALGKQGELRAERPCLPFTPGRGAGLPVEPLQDQRPAVLRLEAQADAVELRLPGVGAGDIVHRGRVGTVVVAHNAQ